MRWVPALVSMSAIALAGCTDSAVEADAPTCDRSCLVQLAGDYVAALATHDPSGLPLAENVAFVENIEAMDVGEGLWETATSGATDFAITVPDEEWQSVGWFGMIGNAGEPTMLAVRLKLEDGQITEIEHRVVAPAAGMEENLAAPRAGLVSEVPEEARLPHDELVRIGASYYDAVDDNDGSLMPFAEDCERHENGIITSGPKAGNGPNSDVPPIASDCAGQLSAGVMAYITTIGDRFVFAADPVTGLAMGFSSLQHPMDFEPYPITSMDGTVTMRSVEDLGYEPWDNVAAHIWKVGADGMVHEIEALGFRAPSGAATDFARTSVRAEE